jgi:hypothetical protein
MFLLTAIVTVLHPAIHCIDAPGTGLPFQPHHRFTQACTYLPRCSICIWNAVTRLNQYSSGTFQCTCPVHRRFPLSRIATLYWYIAVYLNYCAMNLLREHF